MNEPSLAERMRDAAEHRFPAHAEELRRMADDLDASADASVPKLVGTWARVRRRWCQISGEELV